jgi:hypothetical protein
VEREPSWERQLLVGLSVLLAVGLLIGMIVAVVAVKAADYAGIGGGGGSSSPAPILPTTGDATRTAPPTTRSLPPTSTPPPTHQTHQTHHTKRPQHAMTLVASPTHAGTYQRIDLTGTYAGHASGTLQVQQSVGNGPWSDFPVTASVSAGSYRTYIETGRTGTNRFRMLDRATGAMSNVVTVRIG